MDKQTREQQSGKKHFCSLLDQATSSISPQVSYADFSSLTFISCILPLSHIPLLQILQLLNPALTFIPFYLCDSVWAVSATAAFILLPNIWCPIGFE